MRWLLVIWFGETAPARKGRDLLLVALPCLVADVVTKCLALRFLKEHPMSFFSGGLTLLLRVNETLFSHGQTPSRLGYTEAQAFWVVMSMGLSAVACFPFARAQWTVPRKLILMLAVFLGGGSIGALLGSRLDWDPPRLVLHAMRAFNAMAILMLGLRLTRSRYLGFAVLLALAGTLGNSINVLYYPRGIIDFIYVPRISVGVFNLADAALVVAMGLILLSPVALVFSWRLGRRNPDWARRVEYRNRIEPTTTEPKPNQG